jgi:hypothetical protein
MDFYTSDKVSEHWVHYDTPQGHAYHLTGIVLVYERKGEGANWTRGEC